MRIFHIQEQSMFPTVVHNNTILVSGWAYFFSKPSVGDIVVIEKKNYEKKFLLKRITKEKNNTYFVLGDNKKESIDSRQLGWIKRSEIVGKMIKKIS